MNWKALNTGILQTHWTLGIWRSAWLMTEVMMDEKWSIDKLDGSNWVTWKFQMRHLLLAKELWVYVDGMEVLGEDARPQTQAEFQKKSQK